ncbi:hypothetical protein L3Q82_002059 [Scortum barcoo]|uniref:Uncharacterized protein n=1 Tax=Scortum barcoo TaxID=214431 RepID=A0ACB8W1V8_9TELE|nr:hypothetical protein L3Q82_002059 [Scortum barcoo]
MSSTDLERMSLSSSANSVASSARTLSANVRKLHNALNLLLSDFEREQFIHCLNVYHSKRNVYDLVQTLNVILNAPSKRQLLPMLRLVIPRSDQLLFEQYTSEGLYLKSDLAASNGNADPPPGDFPGASPVPAGHFSPSNPPEFQVALRGSPDSFSTSSDGTAPLVPLLGKNFVHEPPGELRQVTMKRHKSNEGLGFSIRGGSEHGVGIYVSLVEPGSLAEKEGLRIGDQIMKVNDKVFDKVTHAEAVKSPEGQGNSTNAMLVKSQQRTFYDSVVASAIFYGIVCWASSITDRRQEENGQTGEEGQLCPGMPPGLSGGGGKQGRMMAKLSSLLNNTSHPLQDTLTALGSSFSERLLHPRCVKERLRLGSLPSLSSSVSHQQRSKHANLHMHLVGKLGLLGFSTPLCNWLLDFLTERPRSVWVGKNTSSIITLSRALPRLDKTKEIIVDFRKIQPSHAPLLINNSAVEVVSSTKFLGVHITDDLTWSVNSASLVKRAQQHLHFLRRMKRAHLPPPILTTLYRSTVESILTNCISVWDIAPQRCVFPGQKHHQGRLTPPPWTFFTSALRKKILQHPVQKYQSSCGRMSSEYDSRNRNEKRNGEKMQISFRHRILKGVKQIPQGPPVGSACYLTDMLMRSLQSCIYSLLCGIKATVGIKPIEILKIIFSGWCVYVRLCADIARFDKLVLKGSKKLCLSVRSVGRIPGGYVTNHVYTWVDPQGRSVSPPPDLPEHRSATLRRTDSHRRSNMQLLQEGDEKKVNLVLDDGRSLGLMIRGGAEYALGIYITGVDQGSAAECGGLKNDAPVDTWFYLQGQMPSAVSPEECQTRRWIKAKYFQFAQRLGAR